MCSGTSPDDRLVEVIELPGHPFFMASQFHPEFKSRPNRPEPLFREFVGAALERARERGDGGVAGRAGSTRRGARARPRADRGAGRRREALTSPTETFVRLCEIESPSGRELEMSRAPSRAELESLGLEVVEDDTAAETGAECGNLLARLPGPEGARTIMLGAHLDTVPLADRVEVECVDGVFRNRRDGDPRRRQQGGGRGAARAGPPLRRRRARPSACELLFTTSEENGLRGAKAFDRSRLEAGLRLRLRPRLADRRADRGRSHLLPGDRRVQRPGRARRHPAGGGPQRDRRRRQGDRGDAARPPRRGDDGERRPDRGRHGDQRRAGATATLEAEVRSLDDDKATRAGAGDGRCAHVGGEQHRDRRRHRDRGAVSRLPDPRVRSLRAGGRARRCATAASSRVYAATGGGSDANAFEAKGFRCLNVANGTEANHTPDERVSACRRSRQMLDVDVAVCSRARRRSDVGAEAAARARSSSVERPGDAGVARRHRRSSKAMASERRRDRLSGA